VSAYVVGRETIDAIVSGARQYGGQTGFSFTRFFPGDQPKAGYSYHKFSKYASDDEAPDAFNPDTIGRELWQENLRSIHHRYPDTIDGENIPGPLDFSEVETLTYTYGPGSRVVGVDPFGLLGVLRCYEYQSCEHPEWGHSVAKAFCGALRSEVIDHLIDLTGANAWHLDTPEDITGTITGSPNPAGGWSLTFSPGTSNAVSLTERIARGR
jgi:hypothetical protein